MGEYKTHPVINQKFCKKCELCVAYCPKKVFTATLQEVVVENPEKCTGCLICYNRCPDFAVDIVGEA